MNVLDSRIAYIAATAPTAALDNLKLIEDRLRDAANEVARYRARLDEAIAERKYGEAADYVQWAADKVVALTPNLRLDLNAKRAGELTMLATLLAVHADQNKEG